MTQTFNSCYRVCCLLLLLISLAGKGFAYTKKNPVVFHTDNMRKVMAEDIGEGPAILIESAMDVFKAEVEKDHIQSYRVYGNGFLPGQPIVFEVSEPLGSFSIAASSDSGFDTSLGIGTTDSEGKFDQIIYVKYKPKEEGGHSATINHSVGDITERLSVDGNATTLPVTWLSFTARAAKEAITLDWVTASEMNNSHFEVEVSKEPAAGFETIGRVDSKPSNSSTVTHYLFVHALEAAAGRYYFRLKQVDIDHTFEYSKLIAVEIPATNKLTITVAPNPLTASSQINVTAEEAGTLNLVTFNMKGTELFNISFDVDKGKNNIKLPLRNMLLSGLYILQSEFKGQFSYLRLIKK